MEQESQQQETQQQNPHQQNPQELISLQGRISGINSRYVNLAEEQIKILETAISELSNSASRLGGLLAEMASLQIFLMRYKKNLLLSFKREADGANGQPVVENLDSDEN